MAIPVVGPGLTPSAPPAGGTGGQHVVGVRVVFTGDVSHADRAVKALTQSTEKLKQTQGQVNATSRTAPPVSPVPGVSNLPPTMRPPTQSSQALAGLYGNAWGDARAGRNALGWNPNGQGALPGGGGWSPMSFNNVSMVQALAILGTVNNLAKALTHLDDSAMSTRDKVRELAGVIPLVGSAFQQAFDTAMTVRDRLEVGSEAYLAHKDKARDHPYNLGMQAAELYRQGAEDDIRGRFARPALEAEVYRRSPSPYDFNFYREIDREVNPFAKQHMQIQQDELRDSVGMARDREIVATTAAEAMREAEAKKAEAKKASDALERERQRLQNAHGESLYNPDVKPGAKYGQVTTGSTFGVLGAVGKFFGMQGKMQGVAGGGAYAEYSKYDDPHARMRAEDSVMQMQKLQAEATAKRLAAEKAIGEAQQKNLDLQRLDVEQQKKRLEYLKAHQAVREQELQLVKSGISSFTLMAPDQQAAMLQANQRTGGDIEKMTAEERGLLMQNPLSAQKLREQAEKDAMARIEQGKGREAQFLQQYGINYKQMTAEVEKARIQIDVNARISDQQAKDAMMQASEEIKPMLLEIVKITVKRMLAETAIQAQQSHAMRKAQ